MTNLFFTIDNEKPRIGELLIKLSSKKQELFTSKYNLVNKSFLISL